MSESIYKIIELVGTSETSWDEVMKNCIDKGSEDAKRIARRRSHPPRCKNTRQSNREISRASEVILQVYE